MLRNKAVPPVSALPSLPKAEPHRPFHVLANLPVKRYVNTMARVASFKVRAVTDELGEKQVFSGVLEDHSFKVPFRCHKLSAPLEKNLVLTISSAYVHEFDDRGLLLILTEYTRIRPQYSADVLEYVWHPRIGHIHRPVSNIRLHGVVAKVHTSSGLVKRCSQCGTIMYDTCVNEWDAEWDWDVRISAILLDATGSLTMIVKPYLASRLLQHNLGEIFLLAYAQNIPSPYGCNVLSFHVTVPPFAVKESIVDDPHQHRHHGALLVSDGNTRIHYPTTMEVQDGIRTTVKRLDPMNRDDFPIMRRLMDKALDIKINQITKKPFVHGLHLLDDPFPLYRCERAHLYLGFSTHLRATDQQIVVEACPHAYVRESVWDYIQWRRSRGATAQAMKRTMLRYRHNVVLAPFGHYGTIDGFTFKRAGEYPVSSQDDRDLTQFWHDTYGIDVDPRERPLVNIKLAQVNLSLTYPPSCVYFDRNVLYLSAGQQRFLEMKQHALLKRTRAVMEHALRDVIIGDAKVQYVGEPSQRVDVQRLLYHEIQDKVLGRTVDAKGNISQQKERLYFFPYTIAMD